MNENTDSDVKVVLYARASSQKQKDKGLSVSAQLRAMRGFSRQQGWSIFLESSDNGYSGRDRNRPGLAEALVALESGEIDKLVVWKLDRLARDTVLSAAIRVRLEENGVSVYSLHEPIGSSPQEQLMARIFEDIAEFYSANLAQDIKRGVREVAKRGFYPFSTAPIGYERIAVQEGNATRFLLKKDTSSATAMSRIFHEYSNGRTAPEIVETLNSEGVAAGRAKRWTQKRLYYLLRNRTYCGDTVIKGGSKNPRKWEIIKDTHEPIVDRDTFERVQIILDSRGTNHAIYRWESSPYLLSGLLRCGLCGSHLGGKSAKSGKNHYYVCQKYHQEGKNACSGVRMQQRQLEEFVLRQVRAVILDDENLQQLVVLVNRELASLRAKSDSRLQEIDRSLASRRRKLDKLYDALENDTLELADIAPRIRVRRQEIAEIEVAAAQARAQVSETHLREVSLETVLEYAVTLKKTLRTGTPRDRKVFLAGLIQSIAVWPGEVNIEYRLPIAEKPETEDLVSSVLGRVLSGGGGGSRTRVRSAFGSVSTSLVPHFNLNSHSPAD